MLFVCMVDKENLKRVWKSEPFDDEETAIKEITVKQVESKLFSEIILLNPTPCDNTDYSREINGIKF